MKDIADTYLGKNIIITNTEKTGSKTGSGLHICKKTGKTGSGLHICKKTGCSVFHKDMHVALIYKISIDSSKRLQHNLQICKPDPDPLVNLSSLNLSRYQYMNFEPLKALVNLTCLDLSHCAGFRDYDIKILKHLPKLSSLNLSYCFRRVGLDIDPGPNRCWDYLEELPSLSFLDVTLAKIYPKFKERYKYIAELIACQHFQRYYELTTRKTEVETSSGKRLTIQWFSS